MPLPASVCSREFANYSPEQSARSVLELAYNSGEICVALEGIAFYLLTQEPFSVEHAARLLRLNDAYVGYDWGGIGGQRVLHDTEAGTGTKECEIGL